MKKHFSCYFWNVSNHQKVIHRVCFRLAAVGKLLRPERSDQTNRLVLSGAKTQKFY